MTPILYQDVADGWWSGDVPPEPRAFHEALDGYRPTRLLEQPGLAEALGVDRVHVKLETDRFGLPSFKIMGASWATIAAIRPLLPSSWRPRDGLAGLAGALPALTLVAATDGNHGRALARMAALLDLRARIFVPESLAGARVEDIADEGADVVRVAGSYDDAVARSALEGERAGNVLVSDTSWPGYEHVPLAVIDGYATILREVTEQLGGAGHGTPDLVLVQLGVGAFGAAVIRHFRRLGERSPRIVGVEPVRAACVMASLAAGERVHVPGPHDSVMTGLNCGTPSLVAWPYLRRGLDAVVAVEDEQAIEGVRALAAGGVAVGECSGAAVAGACELLAGPHARVHRERLALDGSSSILLFATEGVTDPASFTQAVEEETRQDIAPR
jgi:diaminopropionate ammonia-lyase